VGSVHLGGKIIVRGTVLLIKGKTRITRTTRSVWGNIKWGTERTMGIIIVSIAMNILMNW